MNQNINVFPNNINFIPNQINNPFFFNNPNIFWASNNMNNNFNQNLMNNQFQMMQMFQMMMQNMYNQNNNNNININSLNKNQKLLIDKIIEFYKKNGRQYMNYNEKNQIKQLLNNLDINCPLLKEGNDIEDPLHYVKEKKQLIKFINHDFRIFNVKIQISIEKKHFMQLLLFIKVVCFLQFYWFI